MNLAMLLLEPFFYGLPLYAVAAASFATPQTLDSPVRFCRQRAYHLVFRTAVRSLFHGFPGPLRWTGAGVVPAGRLQL